VSTPGPARSSAVNLPEALAVAGEHGASGSRATGNGAVVRALVAVIVETFRRTEIKHAGRRKSFRAMRNFHAKVWHRPHASGLGARPACEMAAGPITAILGYGDIMFIAE
jgi:hypothetical protein